MTDCKLCNLWVGRRSVCIGGRGSLDSQILFVGQAPGVVEDEEGVPFVGPAGKCLDAVLKDVGLKGRIENICRCWPPGDREPTAKEIAACLPYLLDVIGRMKNLKVIVALGRVATRALTGKTALTKVLGTPTPCKHSSHMVYPIYHPAFILRKPEMADRWVQLLEGVSTLLTGVRDDFVRTLVGRDAVRCIERYTKGRTPVAFDFETTGLDPRYHSLLDISFYSGRGTATSCRIDTPVGVKAVRSFLSSPRPKVVHHVGFEGQWAENHLGVELNNVVADTKLLSLRDDGLRPSNLATLAATYVPEVNGFKIDSQLALEQGDSWLEMDPKVRATRNAVDAYATYVAYRKLEKKLGPEVMKIHREVDLPIARTVARISRRGIGFDIRKLMEMEKEKNREAKRALARARRVGIKCNLGSPQQLADNLRSLGLDTGIRTPTGNMSTGEDALLRLVTAHPHTKKWISPILDYRSAMKFKGTYVKGIAKYVLNGVMGGDILWPGTLSWRPAGKKPNRLNLPRGDFRKCIISRFGGMVVKADYSQAELRAVAALSQDEEMTRIYLNDEDIHDNTALKFFGPGYSKEQRAVAKTVNFGVLYGGGPLTLQATLRESGIFRSVKECKDWINQWKATYHGAWGYMVECQQWVLEHGWIESPSYRIVRRVDARRGDTSMALEKMAREGANHRVQCPVAMITNRAAAKVEDRLDKRHGILVNLVYDELVVETPDNGEVAAAVVKECMEEAAKEETWLTVPFKVDVQVAASWGG